ncbi:MAG: response regulator [Candidatus Nealsonbacteria bacterium CG03_land_8_20_14_0_80_36_12]|uniref:Response regulator n=1 Tax=Candidatus Nealsonbacteria bacterium CG03_land_8_20_14_0_80_36_12 TaxID=1974701 RepID=A0A2M7BZ34_9BACT|nr:MAG: response regulator [Candidatus Nealsonbacteria bacterium CG03_land_8_20_14_0_80_36_12]
MKKILIIEDEEIIIEFLQKRLNKEGYEVSLARNGEKGLQMMRETKPNLVLLDIILPQKGGFEVMEQMEKESELKLIPVIVISNSGQLSELDRAKRLGAKNWIIKTEFDPQEIINKIVRQIAK